MAKYEITRNCGHVETIDIIGPSRDRERKAQWFATKECSDCRALRIERERAEEAEKAKALAAAEGLPALEGTEKQVQWAEQIRRSYLDSLEDEYTAISIVSLVLGSCRLSIRDIAPEERETVCARILEIVREVVATHASAKFWIEAQSGPTYRLFPTKASAEMVTRVTAIVKGDDPEDAATVAKIEEAIRQESRVVAQPATVRIEAIAIGSVSAPYAKVHLPQRDEHARLTFRDAGFAWNGTEWSKLTVNPSAAIAEIGRDLLEIGIRFSFPDQETLDMARTGDFFPSHGRRLILIEGRPVLVWDRSREDMFAACSSVKGARWDKTLRGVTVDRQFVENALEFAVRNGFAIHPDVEAVAEAWRNEQLGQAVVQIKIERTSSDHGVPIPLEVPENIEVHPDLLEQE